MAAMLGYGREAVRVKVKKCEGQLQPEDRKFSVDPQITSFEVLLSILAKAFDIKGEFTVSYRVVDDYGQETYLSLLSDWDLDAAFLSASEPCLCLRVDMKKFEEGLALDDWEMTAPVPHEIHHHHHHHHLPRMQVVTESKPQNRLPGLILNQVERTFSLVQRALNLVEDPSQTISSAPVYSTPCCSQSSVPPRPPLTDAEFRTFLGPLGQLTRGRELRAVVHLGGMEPSLRKVVWKHILNVYPEGMSGKERMDYMKKKTYEYEELRDTWKNMIKKGQMTEELAYVTSMVRKDVLRTDRHHKFYAGSDDNQNIASLFNVLTTYALNHPGVSYCQGMSDLASPLLVTMGDEAHAYITFVALMRRLRPNFTLDGLAMGAKFRHLGDGLAHTDPEFHAYLKSVQADDLLFCYRWLLLEMKREFAFEDALRMLEVLWSSLPLNPPPPSGLQLYEDVPYSVRAKASLDPSCEIITANVDTATKEFGSKVCDEVRTEGEGTARPCIKETEKDKCSASVQPSPSSIGMRLPLRETPYTRLCALRRRTSSGKGLPDRQNQSLDDNLWGRRRLQRTEEQARMARPFFSLDESLTLMEADEAKEKPEQSGGEGNGEKTSENRIRPPIQRQHQVVRNLNEFLSLTKGRKEKDVGDSDRKEIEKKDIRHSGDGAEDGPRVNGDKTSPETESPTIEESSTEDDSADYFPMTTSVTRELRLELESLDRQVFGEAKVRGPSLDLDDDDDEDEEDGCQEEDGEGARSPGNNNRNTCVYTLAEKKAKREEGDGVDCFAEISTNKVQQHQRAERIERYDRVVGGGGCGEEIFVWENPLQCPPTPEEQADLESDGGGGSPGSEDSESGNQGSYSGEVIEVVEAGGGTPGGGGVMVHVKSVTPIKLLRDLGNGPRARRTSSDSSDSSDGEVLLENATSDKPRASVDQPVGLGAIVDACLATNSCEEVTEMTGLLHLGDSESTALRVGESGMSRASGIMDLPPPHEFGGGNPFLMFLCLTLLRQQRDHVMRAGMDANELAMHFDKMVRRHDVARVLNCARHMFAAYLRHHSNLAAAPSPDAGDVSGVRSGGEGCSPTTHFAEGSSELPT